MSSRHRTILSITMLLVVAIAASSRAANVSGILGTQTWTAANSPYIVTGNILIADTATLTVEPGVEVRFNAGTKLQINGELIARGNEAARIVFAPATSPTPGYWQGIEFIDSAVDAVYDVGGNYVSGSILEYCDVSYGGTSSGANVVLTNASAFFDHCTLERSAGYGLRGTGCAPRLRRCTVRNNNGGISAPSTRVIECMVLDNTGTGVSISDASQIVASEVRGNNGIGIVISSTQSGTYIDIVECDVTMNSGDGINVEARSPGARILGNNVRDNGGTGIRCGHPMSYQTYAAVSRNTVANNVGGGIYAAWSTTTIDRNIVILNGRFGIQGSRVRRNIIADNNITTDISGYSVWLSGKVTGNTIANNSFTDVHLVRYSGSSSDSFATNIIVGNRSIGQYAAIQVSGSPVFRGNTLFNDAFSEFRNNNSSSSPTFDASGNYWTALESEIPDLIYDWNDDGSLGIVNYTPFLSAPDPAAPIAPPQGVAAALVGSDVVLTWAENFETDLVGYRVYWGTEEGYAFTDSVDVGLATNYMAIGLPVLSTQYYFAVVALDADADGNDDLFEGHRSWYSRIVTPNLPPVWLPQPDVSGREAKLLEFDVDATDPDGDVLTYAAPVLPAGATFDPETRMFSWTPSYEQEGDTLAVFTAFDGQVTIVDTVHIAVAAGIPAEYVSGTITTTTWANPTYRVTGEITVPAGNVLTIESGVDVLFDANVSFKVLGEIRALGAPEAGISFLPGTSPSWGSLYIAGGDSNVLRYVTFRRGTGTNTYSPEWGYEKLLGGGVTVNGAGVALVAEHCRFDSNTVREPWGYGGGLAAMYARVHLRNCVFTGNSAAYGGAIWGLRASIRVDSCTIERNWANFGGGIYSEYGTNTIADTRIVSNRGNYGSSSDGVGVRVVRGETTMSRSLVAGNTEGYTEIMSGENVLTIDYCTIAPTPSGYLSNGLYIQWNDQKPVVTIRNSIVHGYGSNSVRNGYTPFTPLVAFSDIEAGGTKYGWTSNGNIDAPPLFVNSANLDFRLQSGSPCVDAGEPYLADLDGSRADMGYLGGAGGPAPIPHIVTRESLEVGIFVPAVLPIGNIGGADLVVSTIVFPPAFATEITFPQTISPGDTLFVPIVYTPSGGIDDASATISHNDAYQTDLSVLLDGIAGTPVAGDVSGTWTAASSPYRVIAPIAVPAGDSLVIEPGVDVKFDADVTFTINGALRATGTEQDSVRFIRGDAPEWGGLRFMYADTSVVEYCRISGGNADGNDWPLDNGGGAYIEGGQTHVQLSHTVIRRNRADSYGGGIMVYQGASAAMEWCTISEDSAYYGGGVYVSSDAFINMSQCLIEMNDGGGAYVDGESAFEDCIVRGNSGYEFGGIGAGGITRLTRCLIYGNRSTEYDGGGIRVEGGPITIINSTVTANSSRNRGGGIFSGSSHTVVLINTIVRGNMPDEISPAGGAIANYSNVGLPMDAVLPGIGNVNADPLFADPVAGDYSLLAASPCIDAGSPNSPRDPDGSRADMGAIAFDHGGLTLSLALPTVKCPPGRTALVTVNATLHEASSVELVFTVDSTVMAPDADFLRSHAFADGLVTWRVSGDTVRVAMASASPVFLNDSPLVTLAFRVANDALPDTLPIAWDSRTRIDERAAALADGELIVYVATGTYGDVNGNGTISALDASLILRYVVQLIPEIMVAVADVTANGTVSAYDAALVLRRVVDPEFRFPVEGDLLAKSSVTSPRTLVWVREGSAWVLTIDGPTDILGAEFVLGLPDGAVPVVTGDSERTAFRQEGTALRIALVLTGGSSPTLFRIECPELANPPFIRSMELNEGAVTVDRIIRPVEFSLAQNAPNPFNPETVIRYGLPATGHVELTIYDATGRLVRVLVSGEMIAGAHEVVWNGVDGAGRSVASGVYVYRLSSTQGTIVRRMTLVR